MQTTAVNQKQHILKSWKGTLHKNDQRSKLLILDCLLFEFKITNTSESKTTMIAEQNRVQIIIIHHPKVS